MDATRYRFPGVALAPSGSLTAAAPGPAGCDGDRDVRPPRTVRADCRPDAPGRYAGPRVPA